MVRKLLSERPILIGGLGLAASLGVLGGLHNVLADSTTLISLITVGGGIWWWRHQRPTKVSADLSPAAPVERDAVEAAIAALKPALATLEQELTALNMDDVEVLVARFENCRQTLLENLERTQLRIAIAGHPRTGKTTLIPHLATLNLSQGSSSLALTEVSITAETAHPEIMAELLQQHDAVIYLVTEDLTESVLTDLKTLVAAGQRVVVGFNKQDNFLPDDRAAVLERIQSRLCTLPQTIEGWAIATAPKPIKVRTYDETGQATERLETPTAEMASVTAAVESWLANEVPHLVAQTVMRQVQQLRREMQISLNQGRRQQALPVVEQLQWTAAATAFASPVPSLDLLAAIAINGQLVMDLGRLYQQPLALDQAKTIAAELARIVVKLGIVEVSSQLLTTALKSHAATFVVGGSVQAFSAAYLTRLSGESLMAYFEECALSGQAETAPSATAIGQKLQALLPTTQRAEFLQSLISQGIQKLSVSTTPVLGASTAMPVEVNQSPLKTVTTHAETVPSGEPA